MTNFIINKDFPCSQFQLENRFNSEQSCRDYLANMKWPDGFHCRKAFCTKRYSHLSMRISFVMPHLIFQVKTPMWKKRWTIGRRL